MTDLSPRPGTSTQALASTLNNDVVDDDDLTLNINDEAAEIARLQLPTSVDDSKAENPAAASEDDERIARIEFLCSVCDMHEMVHYYGRTPPFVYGLIFLEDTFVMRDPFQPPPPRWKPKAEYFIALGANCAQCERTVCKAAECSFHYTSTYCLPCAKQKLTSLPLEVQTKLRKQLAANN